jgi:hypothetical protein
MTTDKKIRKINFQVEVNTSIIPPIFTFYNEEHHASNGSVTVYGGEETQIIYNLATPGFCFRAPAITNNFHADVHFGLAQEGQQLIIVDKGKVPEDIGLQLIVEQVSTGQCYASPDPQIKNVPS